MSKLSFTLSILVLHCAFHSIQAQPGETKTGTATISGRVTLKGEPARGHGGHPCNHDQVVGQCAARQDR